MERGRVFFMLILLVFVAGCTRNKNPAVDLTDENSPSWPSWLEVGTPVKIIEKGESPDWSPDGKKIAYVAWINGGDNIFVTSDTGGVSTQITYIDSTFPIFTPSWSPDGSTIAFTTGIRGTPGIAKVFTVLATGGEITQLTPDSLSVQGCDWSPDGTHIVFDAASTHNLGIRLWTVDISDSKVTLLSMNWGYNGWPKYSPNGSKVAFASVMGEDSSRDIWYQVWTLHNDGSQYEQITKNGGDDPCWSPDGEWIAFDSDRSGNCDIYIIPSTGGEEIQITSSPNSEVRPAWSPDGKKIAFDTNWYPGEPGVWVMTINISE